MDGEVTIRHVPDWRLVDPGVEEMGCRVCGTALTALGTNSHRLCPGCGRWPRPLIDAHVEAGEESRERVKVRLIALGNNQYEFRACRIDGEWLEVADTRHDLTFWVARDHIVTVWEERV